MSEPTPTSAAGDELDELIQEATKDPEVAAAFEAAERRRRAAHRRRPDGVASVFLYRGHRYALADFDALIPGTRYLRAMRSGRCLTPQ